MHLSVQLEGHVIRMEKMSHASLIRAFPTGRHQLQVSLARLRRAIITRRSKKPVKLRANESAIICLGHHGDQELQCFHCSASVP